MSRRYRTGSRLTFRTTDALCAYWLTRCARRRTKKALAHTEPPNPGRTIHGDLWQTSPTLTALAGEDGQLNRLSLYSPTLDQPKSFPTDNISVFDLIHHDDLPAVRRAFERLRAAPPGTSEVVNFRWSGTEEPTRYLEATLTNLIEDPAMQGILITALDITLDLQAQQSLLRTNGYQTTLAQVSLDALSTPALEEFFPSCLSALKTCLGASHAYILEYEDESRQFLLHSSAGWTVSLPEALPVGTDDEAGLAFQSTAPVLVHNFAKDQRLAQAALPGAGPQSGLAAAIRLSEDRPYGVLGVYHAEAEAFSQEDQVFLQAIVNIVSLAIENRYSRLEMVRAHEEADRMNRLKSAFLDNLSHEIRTPLASIIGFSELMRDQFPDANPSYLDFIERSGMRLLHTFNNILDFSMLEAGSLEPECEDLDVRDIIRKAVDQVRPFAEDKGLELDVVVPEDPLLVYLDGNLMHRVLIQLLDNAIKFSEKGSIVVVGKGPNNTAIIQVIDQGIGMSRPFLKNLFVAFAQESSGMSRLYEGLGLGLTLAKNLVDLMGGTISVESTKGEGSTFTLVFPIQAGASGTLRSEAVAARTVAPFSVLIVDDNEDILFLMRRYLSRVEGCTIIETAQNEDDALALASRHPFDLVLMDINLGRERNGVDVLHALRQLDAYRHTPVIAVTAYAMTGEREHFLEAGFDEYLAKPFTLPQLRQTVTEVFRAEA